MDSMNIVMESYSILIPVLYVVGIFLKGSPKVSDWMIPWILLVLGIGLSFLMKGVLADAIIQGILVTGSAVFGNQLFKQTAEGLGIMKNDSGDERKDS